MREAVEGAEAPQKVEEIALQEGQDQKTNGGVSKQKLKPVKDSNDWDCSTKTETEIQQQLQQEAAKCEKPTPLSISQHIDTALESHIDAVLRAQPTSNPRTSNPRTSPRRRTHPLLRVSGKRLRKKRPPRLAPTRVQFGI